MAKETTQETNVESLQDFKFDEPEFFGIKTETTEIEEVVTKVKKEDEPDDAPIDEDEDNPENEDKSKKVVKKENETPNDEDFFKEDVEDTTDEGGDKHAETEDKFYTTLASELKEKGIFQNVEIKDDEEITEEKFFELQDAEIEARVEESFEAFFEELDEDGKEFLKHKKNGGATQDFFQVYQNSISIDGVDLENEKDQDLILTHYMRVVDTMDEDEINDRIEWLSENKKKKAFAEKYFNKLQDLDKERRTALAERTRQITEQREAQSKKFNDELSVELNKVESVGSFSFNKVDKKDLLNFISKPTIKVGKNKYVTPLVAEMGEIFKGEGENKKKLLLLAKLVKSNFDVKDLIEEAKTKVVKEAKSKLQAAKTGVKPSTSGGYNKKSLADYNF